MAVYLLSFNDDYRFGVVIERVLLSWSASDLLRRVRTGASSVKDAFWGFNLARFILFFLGSNLKKVGRRRHFNGIRADIVEIEEGFGALEVQVERGVRCLAGSGTFGEGGVLIGGVVEKLSEVLYLALLIHFAIIIVISIAS